MKTNNLIIKIIFTFAIVFLSSCETIDLDQLEDPSTINQSFLDPIYTINYVQLQLPNFVDSANDFTQRVTRQMAMTGGNTYDNAFAPVNSNNNWSTAYVMLNAIKLMEPKALEKKQFYILGAAKIIRCYVLMSLVDLYGDIPVSEALLGNQNLSPKYDKSADVYKQILFELDEAIAILSATGDKTDTKLFNDLYYKSPVNWVTLAKTLKIKLFNTARLAGNDIGVSNIGVAINSIVAAGDYIDIPSKDFAFNYGNSRSLPNTRHPLYNDQYEVGGGAYISNYMMWSMTIEKKDPLFPSTPIIDPRTNFYFFKQRSDPSSLDTFTVPGRSRPSHYNNNRYNSFYLGSVSIPYTFSNWTGQSIIPANGYLGRDHGDNSGIPPDAIYRTVCGLYPIGGKYASIAADEKSVQNSGVDGAKGAGIMPILLSSFVHFMLAETYLTSGSGNAKTELLLAIDQSITKTITPVNNYPVIDKTNRPFQLINEGIYPAGTFPPLNSNTNEVENLSSYGKINIRQRKDYLDFIDDSFSGFSNSKKLELIIKEFDIACWGNGLEAYNNYRRTGYPTNFQPTLEPSSGDYFSTALYPQTAINNNPNTPSNLRTRKVFWDKSVFSEPLQ